MSDFNTSMQDVDGDCVSKGIVSQISTEQLKSVALRYWKQALQMTKPKKILAEMLLKMIDTLSNNILDLLSQPECPLVLQEDIGRALEPCLTDIFDFLLGTTHNACAPLFKALSAEVCSTVNSGQSHSEIQPTTSYMPPKEHLVKMIHQIKPLLRFASDQECQKRYSEPLPEIARQTNAVRHHSADFSTRGPQVSEESECSDSESETRSTERKVSSDTKKVTPTMASNDTIIQIQYIAEEAATEMFLKSQENKPKELLRPLCKDQEAPSQVEFQWNDQHWCYLLQEVCSRVLGTSDENDRQQFFQMLLKNVKQQKSACIVQVNPDLHHIREVANAIHQDLCVEMEVEEWIHFAIYVEPEHYVGSITKCILKWVSMPQPMGSIQKRASSESFSESHKRMEALWNDQHWSCLLREVCFRVLGTSEENDIEQLFQLLLKCVEQHTSDYIVRVKPDLHHIREAANAIHQDVIAKMGQWMLFTIFFEPELSAATITDCILKWVSMPQQTGFIQERASSESHKTPDSVYRVWLDYKEGKKAPSPDEYIQAEHRAAAQDDEDFMWSNSDWTNLVFELSARVFGTRNPHKLAQGSMSLLGHVQTFKDRCNVRVKPDEHNIKDVANQIYKDLRQMYPKKELRLLAFSDPHIITAGIPKQLERIPKKRTLGTVLRSVCRAIFRWC